MNVTCILGSPRPRGNSTRIAERFAEVSEHLGATVQTFRLNTMNFKGCQGCGKCKTEQERCVLKDDLSDVLEAVRATDILVLATPVYYADVASQMKAFIDRTYGFVGPDYLTNPDASRLSRGKKLVFIQTQEAGEGAFAEIFSKYDLFFKFYGFDESIYLQACNVGQSTDMTKHPDLFEKAEEIAKKLLDSMESSAPLAQSA